ncbi:Muramoyltetrapeptide carboxypeptidase LdcA (peptidoglycan recycling) [Clostridium sp. DSM 8431]|uniref:LD-carboxypeptidase n=1 Tax=Clostridium sp. DSM 8431 TaxID=1761781 RepID=UPI0008EAAA22|nr:LD-carboxypeptidase [Clostridium sp. DSM 8431]SFU83574.1 Muramoyltetrapeptide carboxypeptidase LdcA (peptidoglycan recycling) [Clostridium sp. DSM 8431]
MKNIGIISLSNGIDPSKKSLIEKMIKKLEANNIKVYSSKVLYSLENGLSKSPKLRANALMELYKNPNIEGIFDISGGDLANQVIPYINFEIIKNNPKSFFGYSDLSVILNSIYKKGGTKSFWFQLRHIINDDNALKLIANYLLNNDTSLLDFKYEFLQGSKMEGIVIGGNLRCSLKLAGTDYEMDFNNKILFIESMGGDINKISTYITQYKMMGAFEKVNGVILGTFIELENNYSKKEVLNLILDIIDNKNLPVIKTDELGHKSNSKSIVIGKHYSF